MDDDWQSIIDNMLPYYLNLYKEKGFHIVIAKSLIDRYGTELLFVLAPNETINQHWMITKNIENFEDIPKDQYKVFLNHLLKDLDSLKS